MINLVSDFSMFVYHLTHLFVLMIGSNGRVSGMMSLRDNYKNVILLSCFLFRLQKFWNQSGR